MRILFVGSETVFSQGEIAELVAEHVVELAGSIAAARELTKSGNQGRDYDVFVVDFDLSDGEGPDFVTWLRLAGILAPVIAVSSHERGNSALLDAGANYVCPRSSFADLGVLVRTARAYPKRSSLQRPRPDALAEVVVANMPTAPKDAAACVAKLFDSLLFGEREFWGAFTDELVTHTECRNFLLAHATTLVAQLTGRGSLDFAELTAAVTANFEAELFRSS